MNELKKNNPSPDYAHLLAEVKERVRSAQYAALKAVNTELVGLYWDIGRMIVQRQTDAEHGSAIAEQLSNDLRAEFPGISGFSRRNVFYMREFYLLYRDDERVQPLVAQIGWTHNLVIFQRRVRFARRPKAHRRGNLRNYQDAAQGIEGATAPTGRDRGLAGGD